MRGRRRGLRRGQRRGGRGGHVRRVGGGLPGREGQGAARGRRGGRSGERSAGLCRRTERRARGGAKRRAAEARQAHAHSALVAGPRALHHKPEGARSPGVEGERAARERRGLVGHEFGPWGGGAAVEEAQRGGHGCAGAARGGDKAHAALKGWRGYRERERQRQRERERDGEKERETEGERERERQRETERERDGERERGRERNRERQRETERPRDGEREKDRKRE